MVDTIKVGAWINGRRPAFNAAALDRWARRIVQEAGITIPTIVLNVGNTAVAPIHLNTWPVAHLRAATVALRNAGAVEVGWMIWPAATPGKVAETVEDMGALYGWRDLKPTPRGEVADFICIDAEGRHNSTGWGPGGAALADDLCEGLIECQEAHKGCYLSVTAVPFKHQIRLQDAALLRHPAVRVAEPQAYSKDDPRLKWDDSPYFRPGVIQRGTWARWAPLVADGHIDRLRLGMAIYAQNHPTGPQGEAALWKAVDVAVDLGAREFQYWAWAFMDGDSKAEAERRAFTLALSRQPTPEGATPPEPPPSRPSRPVVVGECKPPEPPAPEPRRALAPLDFFKAVKAHSPVYGPGRGAYREGEGLLITRDVGPGMGFPTPSFHCSSWTNFLAFAFSGRPPAEYTPRGNMANMIRLCQTPGVMRWNTPWDPDLYLNLQAYGDLCKDHGALRPDAFKALLSPGEAQRLYLVGESTYRGGRWRHWHHTSAWAVLPTGEVFRAAADGWKGPNGYSRTPFSLKPIAAADWARWRSIKKYWAFEMNWIPFNGDLICEAPL